MKIIYQQGGDPDKIWEEIKDIVVKTIIVGQPYMDHMYRVCQPECIDNSMCFQILGFDVLIDKHLKPWLIEINHAPSLNTDSEFDFLLKKKLVEDTIKLLCLTPERKELYLLQEDQRYVEKYGHRNRPRGIILQKKKTFEEKEYERFQRDQSRDRREVPVLRNSGFRRILKMSLRMMPSLSSPRRIWRWA